MKVSANILSFLLILLLLVSSCFNRTSPDPQKSTSYSTEKKGGKIEFLSEMHNFGTLKAGEIVSFSFLFKNSGNDSLKIREVLRSCDCIAVKYKEAVIAPGESSEIEVTLNTFGEWGNLIKTLEVHTAEGKKKMLTIMAYVEDEQINNLLKKEK